METAKEILDDPRQPVRALRDHIPVVFRGYGAMSAATFADAPPASCGPSGSLVFDHASNVESAGDSPVWHKSENDVYPGQDH